MQSMAEINNRNINDIHHVVTEHSGFKMIYNCGCNKCCKTKYCKLPNFNRLCIKNDEQHHLRDLVKPCSVRLTRLDLQGHDENKLSNCCQAFPGIRNGELVQRQTILLFESLCETFSLLKAERKKCQETKRVHCNDISSSSSRNQINKTSEISKPCVINSSVCYKVPYNPKNKSGEKSFGENRNGGNDSEIENEVPSYKDNKYIPNKYFSSSEVTNKIKVCDIPKTDYNLFVDLRSNFNAPLAESSHKNLSTVPVKSKQDKVVDVDILCSNLKNSNSCFTTNPKTKGIENVLNEPSKIKTERLGEHQVEKKLKGTTKKYPVGMNVKLINKNFVCSSNHKLKVIEKSDSSFIKESEGEIGISTEQIVQTTSKEAIKKYPVDINVGLDKENSYGSENYLKDTGGMGNDIPKLCYVRLERMNEKIINSFCNTVQSVIKNKTNHNFSQTEIANQNRTDSCPPSTDISILPSKTDRISNRSTISKFTISNEHNFRVSKRISVVKPCCVVVEKLQFDKSFVLPTPEIMKSHYCENTSQIPDVKRESTFSRAKKMGHSRGNVSSPSSDCIILSAEGNKLPNLDDVSEESMNQYETKSCSSSSNFSISSIRNDKIPTKETISEFNVLNGHTYNFSSNRPLYKKDSPSSSDFSLSFGRTSLSEKESCSPSNYSERTAMHEINFCSFSSDFPISSAGIDKVTNKSTISEFAGNNEHDLKVSGKLPLIKSCCVIDKLSFDKSLEYANPKVMKSIKCEKASYFHVDDESDNSISEAKNLSQLGSFCSSSSDNEDFYTEVKETPSLNAVSKEFVSQWVMDSDFSISSARMDTISNGSTCLEICESPSFEVSESIPTVKPCVIVICRLPFDECLKFPNQKVIKSTCCGQAFYVKEKTENSILESKTENHCEINVCDLSSNYTIFLAEVDKIPNISNASKSSVINKQKIKIHRKALLSKICSIVISKSSADKYLKCVVPLRKCSINNQINVLKFRKMINFVVLKKKKLWFLHKKKMSINCILSKMNLKKSNKVFLSNKWNRKIKLSEECKKDQVEGDLNVKKFRKVDIHPSTMLPESSSNSLPKCSNFETNNCYVHLEKLNVSEYLVENKNMSNQLNNLKCNTCTDVVFEGPESNFEIAECYIILERMNIEKYLIRNKNFLNQYDKLNQSPHHTGSKYAIRNKYAYRSDENSFNSKLKRRSLRTENTFTKDVKKRKKDNSVVSHSNLICDSDYKCVQCRMSITSDVELYHHLCCGKRKKGYICDICEKIFETVRGLNKHLDFHFKFIS